MDFRVFIALLSIAVMVIIDPFHSYIHYHRSRTLLSEEEAGAKARGRYLVSLIHRTILFGAAKHVGILFQDTSCKITEESEGTRVYKKGEKYFVFPDFMQPDCVKYTIVDYLYHHNGEFDVWWLNKEQSKTWSKHGFRENTIPIGKWKGLPGAEDKHIIDSIDEILEDLRDTWIGRYSFHARNCYDFARALLAILDSGADKSLKLTAEHQKFDSATRLGTRRLFGGSKKQKEEDKQASYTGVPYGNDDG